MDEELPKAAAILIFFVLVVCGIAALMSVYTVDLDSVLFLMMLGMLIAGGIAMKLLPRWGITRDDVSVTEYLNRKRKLRGRLIIKK